MSGTPRHWREIDERYNLLGTRCGDCGGVFFPRHAVCPRCRDVHDGKMMSMQLSGRGTVETFSVVHHATADYENETPFVLAIVKLEEGPRLTAMLVDVDRDEVEIGQPVTMRFRRLGRSEGAGAVTYGYKFGPVGEHAPAPAAAGAAGSAD